MGFLTPQPVEGPHFCARPEHPNHFRAGTRWQCDDCGAIYRVEMVWDRNTMNLEWVLKRPAAAKPDCEKAVQLCVSLGHHQPACRCVLEADHDGPCSSNANRRSRN